MKGKNMKITSFALLAIIPFLFGCKSTKVNTHSADIAIYHSETNNVVKVPIRDLNEKWSFYGIGSRKIERGMFYMKEDPNSQGVMVVSTEPYNKNITVKYEIMPMSAASVCVVILSASDSGDSKSLTIPEKYDGSMSHWIQHVDNYFFAFHNAAHNKTPFAIRFPEKKTIQLHDKNVMITGIFSTIEAGRHEDKVWLKVNGESIFEGRDTNPLDSGHLAFRIRGLSEEPASCLIKNVTIESSEN
jgi:hypothetical protein